MRLHQPLYYNFSLSPAAPLTRVRSPTTLIEGNSFPPLLILPEPSKGSADETERLAGSRRTLKDCYFPALDRLEEGRHKIELDRVGGGIREGEGGACPVRRGQTC